MTVKLPNISTSAVKSSQIKSIGHCNKTNTLCVEFHSGGKYHYPNTDAKQFDALKNAKSIGSHFSANIKSKPFLKVPAKKDK